MPPTSPFIDPNSGSYDVDRILEEAIPIAKLVVLFGAVALVPIGLAFLLGPRGPLAIVLTLFAQFVLTVGAAIVLLHVVVRGLQLSSRGLK